MKTIGLLGGMSWESTAGYYRIINETVKNRCGGLCSAKIILHSVDFGPIESLMQKGDWQSITTVLGEAASGLERAGADFFLICTNTMHKLAGEIGGQVKIPLLHIVDPTGEYLLKQGISKVGLLGTAFTMEEAFYTERLRDDYGFEVLLPGESERRLIDRVIFSELCRGELREESKRDYINIMTGLNKAGAEAIILGCTEIGMLVRQEDIGVQLVDTTELHAVKAVELALDD